MDEKKPTLSSTDLAFERTALAYERTQMAWVRTAISLISFGFTLYKFFQELGKNPQLPHRILSPRIVGMILIGFGVFSLLLAQVQHRMAIKRLKRDYPAIQRSLSSVIAVLVLVFGLGLFLAALMRQ